MAEVLGLFEQVVLLAIVRLKDEAYGRAILAEVQTRLTREVAAGAVYATLDRLEAKGLTSSRLGIGTPQRGGRARRFYSIESAGISALDQSRTATANIWRGIRLPLKGRA
jgi:PadR family transcriptional regulator, regulatory protein PadR